MSAKLTILLLFVSVVLAKQTLIRLPKVNPDGGIAKQGRIIGGNPAAVGEYPWQAAIYTTKPDGRYFCGGTLLNDQWILTAAQCAYEATSFTIQLGSNQLSGTDPNRLTVTASKYFINDRFDPTVSLAHDMAVIKLNEPINFTDYIKPVDYYGRMGMLYPGAVLTVTGWGQASDADTNLINDLQTVDVSIIQSKECSIYYGDQIVDGMLCTVGLTNNEGICFGDIGGPLLSRATSGNGTSVMAISSWVSQNGCESAYPKGYTRVDWYNNWLTQTLENN
ncbi:brachyurin-like [Zophobas morio]|uniref:brachyurin-like n=1 Tax=Zophobas morio TaxID=2755281 RepID=UPI003082B4D1